MTKSRIKLANINDSHLLASLEDLCFKTDKLSAKQYLRFIQSQTAMVIVIKKARTIIASAIVLFRKNSTIARLYSIAVHPDFQYKGLGKHLIAYIERHLIKCHYTEIRLEVSKKNKAAITFYRHNNYIKFAVYLSFYADGTDAIRMRKFLSPYTLLTYRLH